MVAKGHGLPQELLTSNALFKQGTQSLKQGNYQLAAKQFEQIKTNRSPQVHFNLGQIYLALNELEKASRSFSKLSQNSDWRSLAWFYLANISQRQQNLSQAEKYYQNIITLNNNLKLVNKSKSYLARLNNSNIDTQDTTDNQFIAHVSFSNESNPLGIPEDSNVNNTSDISLQGWLWGQYYLTKKIAVNTLLSSQDYEKNTNLDLVFSSIGINYSYSSNYNIGAEINNIDSSAIAYQQYSLFLKRTQELSNTKIESQIDMGYFQASDDFNYLVGTRLTLQVTAGRMILGGQITGRYKIYKDNRRGAKKEAGSSSYSPVKQRLTLLFSLPLSNKWQIESYAWLYHHNWQTAESGGLSRTSNGQGYGINLDKQISQRTHVQADLHHEKNTSQDFTNTSFSLSLEYKWN